MEERLSRWLLGSRFSGVPLALGVLGRAGLISVDENSIAVNDREKLEDGACESYVTSSKRLELLHSSCSQPRRNA